MTRVLHVIDHLDLGGAQTALLDMLKHRDRLLFYCEAAVMHGRGAFAESLEQIGVKVHSLARSKWPPMYIPAFLGLVRTGRFQIVHFHLQGANWLAKPLAALATECVRIAHDHTSGDLKFRGITSLMPDAASHLFSSRIIAVSDDVRDFLAKWEAVPREKVEVVPNGVDDSQFRPCTIDERSSARHFLNIPGSAFVVGSLGRLAPEKNFELIPRLAARLPSFEFVIGGAGPGEKRLRALARELGVETRIHLPGRISDRARFYQALDVFVLPSLHEGLPMALLEAMASQLPIVASRLDGIAAALQDGVHGLLATPGVQEFAEKLGMLKGRPELAGRLAVAARARACACYSASATCRRIEEIYLRELAIAKLKSAASNSA